MTEDEKRGMFFSLGYCVKIDAIHHCESIAWGQNRIRHLERDKRDAQELLDQNSELRREIEELEIALEDESLRKTTLTISNSPPMASPGLVEAIHQQRRRERMLDEVTLICVRDGIERLPRSDAEEQQIRGHLARGIAEKVCWGIREFDAE